MSVSSITSPPPPVIEKNLRRVRFSLPEAKLTLNPDKRPVHIHGTSYINGTLINVTSKIHTTTSESKSNGALKNEIKSSLKTAAVTTNGKESSQYKVTFNIKPTTTSPPAITNNREPRHSSLPTPMSTTCASNVITVGRRRVSKSSNGRQSCGNLLPIIGRKSSSVEDFDERERENEQTFPITSLTKYKSSDDLRDSNTFKMISKNNTLRLPEATPQQKALKHPIMTPNTLKIPSYDFNGDCKFVFLYR